MLLSMSLGDRGVYTFRETDKQSGVHNGAKRMREYRYLMNLALSRRQIKFANALQTATRDATAETMIRLLDKQMTWWSHQRGNGDGDAAYLPCEVLDCVMMALYWGKVHLKRSTSN